MVAFAGSSDSLYLVRQLQQTKGFELSDLSSYLGNMESLINKFLESDYSFFIIDLDSFLMEAEIIVESLTRLKAVCKADLIFLAKGYGISSTIIQTLRHSGFKKFVFGETLGDIKTQLSNCLDGIDNITELEKTEQLKFVNLEEKQNFNNKPYHKIAFCGSQARIGTTTQAMNFAKYLQFKGYKVCYIEANQSGQIAQIPTLYTISYEDKDLCKIVFENLDMYYNIYKISKIYEQNYDFYIYDMGVLNESNRFSFLDTDLRVLVAGSKPWEIDNSIKGIKTLLEDEVKYIFSFTDKTIRESLKEDMGDKKDDIFFCEYSPNMFSLNSLDKVMHEEFAKLFIHDNKKAQKKGLLKLFK